MARGSEAAPPPFARCGIQTGRFILNRPGGPRPSSRKGWAASGGPSRRCPPELRERAVRMVAEIRGQRFAGSDREVARLPGVTARRRCVSGCARRRSMPSARPGTTTEESAELKRLRRTTPNCEGRPSALKTAPAAAELTGQHAITRFIADHQGHREGPDGLRWGVESIPHTADRAGCRSPHRPTTTTSTGSSCREA